MGFYSSSQFLGAFLGGVAGGWLQGQFGAGGVLVFCGSIAMLWLLVAASMRSPRYLTTQLLEMGVKVVVALNMHDELEQKGDILDHGSLGKLMGIPFVPTIGRAGSGIDELFRTVVAVHENRDETVRPVTINYGTDIEKSIASLQKLLAAGSGPDSPVPSRYTAIKLLEKDSDTGESLSCGGDSAAVMQQAEREVRALESELKEDTGTLISDARYGFIAGALRETFRPGPRPIRRSGRSRR